MPSTPGKVHVNQPLGNLALNPTLHDRRKSVMPWTVADVNGFRKGLSKEEKKKWVGVANGALAKCLSEGTSEKKCAGRAVRIANSKFNSLLPFNPVMTGEYSDVIKEELKLQKYDPIESRNAPEVVKNILSRVYSDGRRDNPTFSKSYCASLAWLKVEEMGWGKNEEGRWMNTIEANVFQEKKETPSDPRDGHTHEAAYDEDGNGGTDEAGMPPHSHMIYGFKVQPYYSRDGLTGSEYSSVHPGSLAFAELGEIDEMEIFRAGTFNDTKITEKMLEEIADNFNELKEDLRPKLKITHKENQESLAGLSSYGDIVDVFVKKIKDGSKRLFAKIVKVPKQVIDFIKEGRFPERSVELYPEFKLGSDKKAPIHKNVLKAVALLGREMPAVTGMDPIKLSEDTEKQKTIICFDGVCMCEDLVEVALDLMFFETEQKLAHNELSV